MTRPVLLLSESAAATMTGAAGASHPMEAGGVLVGVYADGLPWVTRAIQIPSARPRRHSYLIPAGATQPAVKNARRADARLGYLGDWHTHPDDVGPSTTDIASLAFISFRRPHRPNPTLVVVRRQGPGYALDARRTVGLHVRHCEVRFAGSLD